MNESAPAPVRPPVPWWERVAAGVLAVGWVAWAVYMYPIIRWNEVGYSFDDIGDGWRLLLGDPTLSTLITNRLLRGLDGGLRLGFLIGLPVLVVGGVVLATGLWRSSRRAGLWWLALGHSIVAFLSFLVWGRLGRMAYHNKHDLTGEPLGWAVGWFDRFYLWNYTGEWDHSFVNFFPELLLAVLVLAIGWWIGRRRKEAAAD